MGGFFFEEEAILTVLSNAGRESRSAQEGSVGEDPGGSGHYDGRTQQEESVVESGPG